jgi:Alpha/beta hydrolase of unknown function (DUF900)
MSYPLLSIQKINTDPIVPFPCYFVMSTAPINIEDSGQDFVGAASPEDSTACLEEMTAYLKQHQGNAEVLVLVHGYNTGRENVQWWYREAAKEIARRYPQSPKGLVLIGYRWSSEQMSGDESGDVKSKRNAARQSLPKIMNTTYQISMVAAIAGFIGSFVGYGLLLVKGVSWIAVLAIFSGLFTVAGIIFAPLVTIFALRVSNYFRDTFRANQYGVSDLVELIRQLDDALVEAVVNPDRAAREKYWENHRIRLSFIGHSMGAFVVTNAVRVLSDVFDRASIGHLGRGHSGRDLKRSTLPSSKVGNVFGLGRLVLVAPDISSETIISGRANVLRSSLRRFEEAYLFCNEGDMALRLASTTANYFSFPARTRDGGYRLGNVTVREASATRKIETAGIVNLLPNGRLVQENVRAFLSYLYIRKSRSLLDRQLEIGLDEGTKSIAELFTYFDCTNYRENISNPKTKTLESKGILTRAVNKTSLEMKDYALLCKDFAQGKRDPHGGYIFSGDADFTKQAIYGLACLGWSGFVSTLDSGYAEHLAQLQQNRSDLRLEEQQRLARLFALDVLCKTKGVQVLMSPERYQVDILQQGFDRSAY